MNWLLCLPVPGCGMPLGTPPVAMLDIELRPEEALPPPAAAAAAAAAPAAAVATATTVSTTSTAKKTDNIRLWF